MNKKSINQLIFNQLPRDVFLIMNKIHRYGYECFVVGGALRDILLGKKINDIDLTTNAKPAEIKKIFPKTFDTGIKHGTISIYFRHKIYEITTYRYEGKYLDHRHPSEVKFVDSLKEDLGRRDFTINAFAYNLEQGFIDLFDGLNDLHKHLIKAIGDPHQRFDEDALRMLRAYRFASQIGGKIEKKTLLAIFNLAHLINSISVERIRDELDKILLSSKPEIILDSPLNQYLFSVDLKKNITTLKAFELLKKSPLDLAMRLVLFYDLMSLEDDEITQILKRYKYSNSIVSKVKLFSKHLSFAIPLDRIKIKFLIRDLGSYDVLTQLILLKKHSIHYQNSNISLSYLKSLDLENGVYQISDLAINGDDLINLGYHGKNISIILKATLDKIIAEEIPNQKEAIIKFVNDNFKSI